MKETQLIMGMPVTIKIVDAEDANKLIKEVFNYFKEVDARYSTYKSTSEISKINRGLKKDKWSREIVKVLALCEETKTATNGYFNIEHDGKLDPSGLVKGWAIYNAANILSGHGVKNYYIDAGGDIQVAGRDKGNKVWTIGIKNPFKTEEIIKTIYLKDGGVATSGAYVRGRHIYNPLDKSDQLDEVRSLTVIGPNIYEADRFATAAFAMGKKGINFIESMPGLEAYMVTDDKMATYTSGFERYLSHA